MWGRGGGGDVLAWLVPIDSMKLDHRHKPLKDAILKMKKFKTTMHDCVKMDNSSHLGPPLTSLFYLPLSFYHMYKYEKFCQIFCVYELSIKNNFYTIHVN